MFFYEHRQEDLLSQQARKSVMESVVLVVAKPCPRQSPCYNPRLFSGG